MSSQTATRGTLRRALPVSAAAHAAIFAAALLVSADEPRPSGFDAPVEIDLTALAEPDPETTDHRPPTLQPGGAAAGSAPRATRRRSQRLQASARPETTPEPEPERPAREAAPVQVGDVVGDLQRDLDGAMAGLGGAGLGGRGPGRGAGGDGAGGHGIGDGDGAPSAKASAATSKARAAVLIWPVRTRQIDAERLFVIAVTVDEQGYVDGAKLLRGVDPHLDAKALDAIWRFRYRPALDDDGKPIASVVKQRFMLRW